MNGSTYSNPIRRPHCAIGDHETCMFAKGKARYRKAVNVLMSRGASFRAEPLPDDEYQLTFKAGEGHGAAVARTWMIALLTPTTGE